jgi:histidinol-phosphatase
VPATPDPAELRERLSFALEASREAETFILSHYQSEGLRVDLKGDASPVTIADRGAEELLRERIERANGDDGILGEEYGTKPSRNGWRWLLDPVDGTKSFVHGVPLFGTLVGLEFAGRCVLGVCRFPGLREVVYAAQGSGTWWERPGRAAVQTRVTETARLADALFCTTTLTGWEKIGRADALAKLTAAAGLSRGWGDCYGHVLVATGRADVMVDPQLSPWDAAALIPIVEEAGGRFLDWNGDVNVESKNGFSVNAELWEEVLELLRPNG